MPLNQPVMSVLLALTDNLSENALFSLFCFSVFVPFPLVLFSVKSLVTRAVVSVDILLCGVFFVVEFFCFCFVDWLVVLGLVVCFV